MMKKILIVSDKDLNSKMLTGIELRCLQMASYFKDLGAEVSVWYPKKIDKFLSKIPLVNFLALRGLKSKVASSSFIYSSLTSSKQSTIYRISKYNNHPPIILDLFTPLLLEKNAAKANLKEKEAIVYEEIRAASHYLCATPKQRIYNKNLVSVAFEKPVPPSVISVVPYLPPEFFATGDNNQLPKLPSGKKLIFWIGAFYPWFDIQKLKDLITEMKNDEVCFVIIGGKNPKTKAYDSNYLEFKSWVESLNIQRKTVVFIDWLPYQKLGNLLQKGRLSILFVNNKGEDKLAIRSRLLSSFMAGLPVITNGQDELTDHAVKLKFAYRVDPDKIHSIRMKINQLLLPKTSSKWPELKKIISKWTMDHYLRKLIND